MKAAKHPNTWAPLALAAMIAATDNDDEIAEWASDEKPVFGPKPKSDDLLELMEIIAATSFVFSPQQNPEDSWFKEKATRFIVQGSAVTFANGRTGWLKNRVQRERPYDPAGNRSYSFPSGHATEAFALASLSMHNLNDYSINDSVRNVLKVGINTVAYGTAWSRVEERQHYPVDVLVGAALGNFIASTVHLAFFDGTSEEGMGVQVINVQGGLAFHVTWRH